MPNKDVFMRDGSGIESLKEKDLDGSESPKSAGKDDLRRIEAVFSQTENVSELWMGSMTMNNRIVNFL